MNEQYTIVAIEIWSDTAPPYGYYHLRKIYADGSWWHVAFIDSDLKDELDEIAAIIARHWNVPVINKRGVSGGTIT
jgi:hypothetical protein